MEVSTILGTDPEKLAEERSLALCPDTVALRATWMYEDLRPGMKTHGNFVLNFHNAIKKTELPCVSQQENSVVSHGLKK